MLPSWQVPSQISGVPVSPSRLHLSDWVPWLTKVIRDYHLERGNYVDRWQRTLIYASLNNSFCVLVT
jgi:hypothetical protein